MRALLAFDKFKDALTAPEACAHAAAALREVHPHWQLDLCPLTDGGEGFAEILTRAAGGVFRRVAVSGPRGALVEGGFGLVERGRLPSPASALLTLPRSLASSDPIALIAMADASGLALLAPGDRDPWQTTTLGTGQLLRAAADSGARALVLGVGGSATNDLGVGALAALGIRFTTAAGAPVDPPVPARWNEIARLEGAVTPSLPPVRIACDVVNPLLGPHGCATVFGPQKGLRPADLPPLEAASARLAALVCTHFARPVALADAPGAGAAGGLAFGLSAGLGARIVPGFDLVSAWLDLDARLAAADVVLTGEGRFDASSLAGKGPGAIVAQAAALGRPTHVFAGRIGEEVTSTAVLHAISPPQLALEAALRATPQNLRAAVARAFR